MVDIQQGFHGNAKQSAIEAVFFSCGDCTDSYDGIVCRTYVYHTHFEVGKSRPLGMQKIFLSNVKLMDRKHAGVGGMNFMDLSITFKLSNFAVHGFIVSVRGGYVLRPLICDGKLIQIGNGCPVFLCVCVVHCNRLLNQPAQGVVFLKSGGSRGGSSKINQPVQEGVVFLKKSVGGGGTQYRVIHVFFVCCVLCVLCFVKAKEPTVSAATLP